MINNLIETIKENMTPNAVHPFVIAIDGMSGSGKTTLAKLLQAHFPASNVFHMDDYFLQPHQRTQTRLCEAGGNVDYERFQDEILSHINDKCGLAYHKYNCHTQKLSLEILATWKPLVIIEGAYSQHPYFGPYYNLGIFCEMSDEEQKQRILKRNGPDMLNRFLKEWIPKENLYFQTYCIKENNCFLYHQELQ